jgi:aminoglycoside/choline kinase family phosphotransferase
MHLNANTPGIIDFQDAVIGPVTYDAVSLLRDCYINWPDEQIERWLLPYYQQLKQASLVSLESSLS